MFSVRAVAEWHSTAAISMMSKSTHLGACTGKVQTADLTGLSTILLKLQMVWTKVASSVWTQLAPPTRQKWKHTSYTLNMQAVYLSHYRMSHCNFIFQNNVTVQILTFSAQHRTAVHNGTWHTAQGLVYIMALGTTQGLLYIMALGTQHKDWCT